jgi:hypothetical protein
MPPKKLSKLIVFDNEDKESFREEVDCSNPANFCHPFRLGLYGPPSCGKTSLAKNIILQQNPPFENIVVYHLDIGTKEYGLLDCELINQLPPVDEFNPNGLKTLLIIEDIPYQGLPPKERTKLDRYMGYVSSHKGVSIICTGQNIYSSPPSFRRMMNILCIWKMPDMTPLYTLSRQMGLDKRTLDYIFSHICKAKYDCLTINNCGGPFLLKNLFQEIPFDG